MYETIPLGINDGLLHIVVHTEPVGCRAQSKGSRLCHPWCQTRSIQWITMEISYWIAATRAKFDTRIRKQGCRIATSFGRRQSRSRHVCQSHVGKDWHVGNDGRRRVTQTGMSLLVWVRFVLSHAFHCVLTQHIGWHRRLTWRRAWRQSTMWFEQSIGPFEPRKWRQH